MKKLVQTSGMLIICASLFACTSPIQKMTPLDAVKFGNDQFYSMPSYRMDMSAKVMHLGFTGMAGEKNLKESETFSKYMNFFSKNFVFNGTGVFDTVNDQYQIIPEYGYEAKNINGRIRFPIVLDRKAKLLYADLSALDGIVTNLDNAGKYSRFDLSKLPITDGADKKLIDVMRKYTTLMFEKVPAQSIIDQPLSADDRKLHAVRKLQMTLKPHDQLALYPQIMEEMVAIFAPNANKDNPEFKQETDKIKSSLNELLAPESRDVYTFAFNRAGQIISMKTDSNYLVSPKAFGSEPASAPIKSANTEGDTAPPQGFQMHFVTDTRISDIGTAKLIDPPTADNSVDGMENIKNSAIGKIFAAKVDDSASDTTETAVDAAATATEVSAPAKKRAKKKR